MDNRRRFYPVVFLAVLSLASAGCFGITKATPRYGLPGTVVVIEGNGFSPNWWENQVTIGGKPARVIDATPTRLRVVALRDFVTGRIKVITPTHTLVSKFKFLRRGDTLAPTPESDSGSELVEGRGFPGNKRYDMQAQGTNQKILVVLAKPADIDPEMQIPAWANGEVGPFANSKEFIQRIVSHPDRGTNRYFIDATYGKTSADFLVTDWQPLSQNWDFYAWGPDDVTRAQNGVNGAQADLDTVLANPASTQADIDAATAVLNTKKDLLKQAQDAQGFLQQGDFAFAEALIGAKNAMGDAAFNQYGDFFLVLAGPWMRGSCCWVVNGFHAESTNPTLPLGPFDIDFPAPRGGTWMAEDGMPGRMAHELSHFFASGDLYDGTADRFDLMGDHDHRPLYSAYNQHIKGNWVDQSMNGNVVSLQWGTPADMDQTFELTTHGKTEDPIGNTVKQIIKLRVTDGLFYFVEVRQNPDPSAGAANDYAFDPDAPAGEAAVHAGVLITKALESNNQSNALEPSVTLVPPETASPRSMSVGEVFTDPARTIRISVVSRTNDRPARYQVRVEWGHLPAADPNGQFDLRITPWNPPPWETVDIWCNSVKNDETMPPRVVYQNHEPGDDTLPVGNGDPPWVGHDNTLFARITNQGMVETPEDVRVTFYVNTPPGIGDNGTWGPFDTVVVGHLMPGETRVIEATRKWKPSVGEHTCVKVQIEPMTGEVTFDNNQAQENFGDFEAEGSSPYKAVEMDLTARNPYDIGIAMDLQARNVPKDWYVALDHGAVWLAPKAEKRIHAVIWTDRVPEWAHENRKDQGPPKAMIDLEGWVRRPVDRIFAVGGVTALTHAVRHVDVRVAPEHREMKKGTKMSVVGSVAPAVEGAPIAIHLIDPNGRLAVVRAATDAAGHFTASFNDALPLSGVYKLQAFVLTGGAAAEAESPVVSVQVF